MLCPQMMHYIHNHRGNSCMGMSASPCGPARHDGDNVELIPYFYLQLLIELYGGKWFFGAL